MQCIRIPDRNHYRLLILLTAGLGTNSASFCFAMSFDDSKGLDYIDEDYEWNRPNASVSEAADLEAEFLALLDDGLSEQVEPEDVSDGETLLADLDAALGEIESEIRAEAQEMARPSKDAVELLPTWDRIYKVGSQNFICADRITTVPKLQTTKGEE